MIDLCPPWLYQPQCESGPLWRDGLRCWWATTQRTVRTNPVIDLPSALHEHRYSPKCIKQIPIQQFIT